MNIPVTIHLLSLPEAMTVVLGLFPSELTLSPSPSMLLVRRGLSQCSQQVATCPPYAPEPQGSEARAG